MPSPAFSQVISDAIQLSQDGASAQSPIRRLPSLCCQAAGGAAAAAERANQVWRLLYLTLHLLDNLEDGDALEQPWARWGAGPVINFTTGLLIQTLAQLDTIGPADGDPALTHAVKGDFYQTILLMCAGQHDDLTLAEPSLEQCWQIAEAKSACFFALASRTGARMAGADVQRVALFGQFGHSLGMLLQINDDIGGMWAQEGARSDLLAGPRWTLPVAYAMAVLPDDERRQLSAALGAAADPSAEAEARKQIITSGAMLYLAVEAQRYAQRARAALQQAAPDGGCMQLLELIDTLVPKPAWFAGQPA